MQTIEGAQNVIISQNGKRKQKSLFSLSNMRLYDTKGPSFEEFAIFKLPRAVSLELFFHFSSDPLQKLSFSIILIMVRIFENPNHTTYYVCE